MSYPNLYPTKLSKTQIQNVIDSFWIMMTELASQADNENDPVLKMMVEGFARQWRELTGATYNPPWLTRPKQAAVAAEGTMQQ